MISSNIIQGRLERILPSVEKPGRYTGGELNQIVKSWESVQTRVALVFPDIYDLGMSNLGLAILYDLINRRSDALAERAFSPWVDMEQKLRQTGTPLFSLETKHALAEFDIIGISLPYETLYTNTLNILDLGGIPVFAAQRDESHPLVIAGGHATYNPGADARLHRCLCDWRRRRSHPGDYRCPPGMEPLWIRPRRAADEPGKTLGSIRANAVRSVLPG